jgi:hypothetical protein
VVLHWKPCMICSSHMISMAQNLQYPWPFVHANHYWS